MSKIAIIRTPFVNPSNHISSITAIPDIGSAYINGALQKAGHESFIIDAPGESIKTTYRIKNTSLEILGLPSEEIIKRLPLDIDMVGVQCMHSNRWIYDSQIIRMIKENFPHVKIFVGGEHATACPEFVLNTCQMIDACVIGEGEETVVELVQHLKNDLPLDRIQGIAFLAPDGKIQITERRKRLLDLDEIPRPSWTNVPIESYLHHHCGINSLAKRSIPVMATRGCPFSCTFCTVPNMWESRWHSRSPEDVVDEIKNYVSLFNITHVDFVDLTIVVDPKWMNKFCKLLIAQNLNLTWAIPIGTRTENLSLDLLKLMKQSGLTRVLYSAESGSKNMLEIINKKLDLTHFSQIVRETSKLGICAKVALIFGFPGQRRRDIIRDFIFINKLAFLGLNDIVCLSFVPYPKTKLYDELKVNYDYNSISNNIRLNNDIPNMKSWSKHFGDRFLRGVVWFFTLYFYALQGLIRPYRVFAGGYRIFIKKKPLTNFETIIYNMIFASRPNQQEVSASITGSL